MISKKTAGKSRLLALLMCICMGLTSFGCSKKDQDETSKKAKKTKNTEAEITEIESEESELETGDPDIGKNPDSTSAETTDDVTEKTEDSEETEAVSETEKPDEIHPREKSSYTDFLPYVLPSITKSALTPAQVDTYYRFCEAVLAEESSFPCDNFSDYETIFYSVAREGFPYGYAVVEAPEANDVRNGVAQIRYSGTKEWREEHYRVLKEGVEEILKNVLSPEYSDFENALALYQYFVDSYVCADEFETEDDYCIGIYRVLVRKRGVCQDFALTYMFLLQQVGVDIDNVTGACDPNTYSSHEWNIICLDGEYYMIDTTWGVGRNDLCHFLMTTEERTRNNTIFVTKMCVGACLTPYEGEYLCESETYKELHEGTSYTWDQENKVIYYGVTNDDGTYKETMEFHYA